MSYEKTVWHNNDIITASKLNKIEEGIAKAGSDYDLIIEYYPYSRSSSINDFTIVKGDILELEEKAAEFEPINGILIRKAAFSSVPSGSNILQLPTYFHLTEWNGPEHYIGFSADTIGETNYNSHSLVSFYHAGYTLLYNPSTGNLTNWAYGYFYFD